VIRETHFDSWFNDLLQTALALYVTFLLAGCTGVTSSKLSPGTSQGAPATPQYTPSTQQYTLGDTLYPYSTQSQPSKGASYTDPTYHLTVTRLTDINSDNPSIHASSSSGCGYGIGSGYPTWNPLNSDRSKIILYGIQSDCAQNAYGYQLYNASTGVLIEDLKPGVNSSPLAWWNNNDAEPRWDRSGNHPTLLYYRKNMQLRSFDVSTLADSLVHDFCNEFGPSGTLTNLGPCETDNLIAQCANYILTHEYGSPDMTSRYWAWYVEHYDGASASGNCTGDGGASQRATFVYDLVTNSVVSYKVLPSAFQPVGSTAPGAALKGILMSPDGNYVMVNYWDSNTGVTGEYIRPHIYTRDFSTNVQATSGGIPHSNWAYDEQGHLGVFMLNDNYLTFTRADNGNYFLLYPQASLGWNGSNTLTAFQKQPGWGFFSTYGCDTNPCTTASQSAYWDYNQIYALELNETKCISWSSTTAGGGVGNACPHSPRIWRVSSTQNYVDANYYLQQPNAQMDYEGTTIWWGANWRTPEAVHEVYTISLPPNWASDLAAQ
jgi:hypothetical protein